MKYLFTIFIFFGCGNSIFAHEPNEAFFTFNLKNGLLTVEAEVPWSMRNALMDYNPKLEKSNNKQDFENTFFEYIKHNLILKDKNGAVLEFQKFEELKNNGHSHQNNYLLTFKGEDCLEVTNTIMFNLYKNQLNFNTLTWNNTTIKTSQSKPSFYLNAETTMGNSQNWWIFLIPMSIVILIFIRKKRSSTRY